MLCATLSKRQARNVFRLSNKGKGNQSNFFEKMYIFKKAMKKTSWGKKTLLKFLILV